MSLLLLATGLTLLGSPQTLHQGPQDSNFNETLVSGDWFSAALASNRPRLLQEGADAQLFIHSIQVTPRALQLHLHRKVQFQPPPPAPPSTFTDGGQKRIFLEEVDPKSYVIFCTHHKEQGKETVVVTLFSRTPKVTQDTLLIFKNYCKSHGIHKTNIINVTKAGTLPPSQKDQKILVNPRSPSASLTL
ncbi:Uterocalin [Camelus dromedarius]|uniref:Uterocalin n=1 Tax=Camelus dromedarius TaxID=9838 RepID=A0A5N4EBI4_CAMDR|nr:Uterocalin [Camelus dromedarius]